LKKKKEQSPSKQHHEIKNVIFQSSFSPGILRNSEKIYKSLDPRPKPFRDRLAIPKRQSVLVGKPQLASSVLRSASVAMWQGAAVQHRGWLRQVFQLASVLPPVARVEAVELEEVEDGDYDENEDAYV